MGDAYAPLTWAGLDVTIQDASGDDANAVATPVPLEEQHAPALVDRLADRVDDATTLVVCPALDAPYRGDDGPDERSRALLLQALA